MLGAIAMALVATGVGVATAGEVDAPRAPFWPQVEEDFVGPEAGADLSFPKIENVTLTCAGDGKYELWFAASVQPGAHPEQVQPADGDVEAGAGVSWPAHDEESDWWSFGGDGMTVSGDAVSTRDTAPSNPDWLVFGGRTLVSRTTGKTAPARIGDGIGVHVNLVKYEQRDGAVTEVARKRTNTLIAFPPC